MPYTLIALIVICVLTFLITAEVRSIRRGKEHVSLRWEFNMSLTEPDEIVTMTYQIQNTSALPIPFVSFSFRFPDGVEVRESADWIEAHRIGGSLSQMYSFDVNLRAHRGLRGKIHLCLKERGLYEMGTAYIETGDFLGFRSAVRHTDIRDRIICTARAFPEGPKVEPLGGYLGDISVRRFIMEDPSLILGYREYTGAEPLKSISWLQTARTGALTVKKHDFTVDTDVAVILDVEQCPKAVAERCLSLVRTVCDVLEERRIPFSVLSNGDLFATAKGSGRMHNFEVQRRIGLARFTRYYSLQSLFDHWSGPGFSQRGSIVIAPRYTEALAADLARFQSRSGVKALLLLGEEEW